MSIFETRANGSPVVLPGYLRATPFTATCTISTERESIYSSIIMVMHWSVGTVRYGVDMIKIRAHTSVFRRRLSDTQFVCHRAFIPVAPVGTNATESVRCRPRTTRGGEPAVVPTAMTRTPMGPHWPGHSPTRETNESSPGVSPVPSECGLEPKGGDRPNPMVGFHVLQGVEEVNASPLVCNRETGLRISASGLRL